MNKYEKLLSTYSLEALLEFMEIEPIELLELLDEMGYLSRIPPWIPEELG